MAGEYGLPSLSSRTARRLKTFVPETVLEQDVTGDHFSIKDYIRKQHARIFWCESSK